MIPRHGVALLGLGLPPGILAWLWISRFASSLVSGVDPEDPLVLAIVAVLVGVTTLVAVLVPARNVAHVDPLAVLRAE